MNATMRVEHTFTAAGGTDTGLQRDVNEDRFHCDPSRGVFVVIDGVGGHAAGGRAADVALAMIRARLDRETGPLADRLREAMAIASTEIHRLASTRPEWSGMACVVTGAIVSGGRATIGHVGDTRLYKFRGDDITKVTRDHSPVGEREDAHELSETDAMRHPRRNEVYRDVGSEPHQPDDPEFVDITAIDFEPDAALLLCSDGLTDLVSSTTIAALVRAHAGDPAAVVRALIAEANRAGGKDNVTVVYVEGAQFHPPQRAVDARRRGRVAMVAALSAALAAAVTFLALQTAILPFVVVPQARPMVRSDTSPVVLPSQSIAAAIARAEPGSQVVVEPGEYREQLRLRSDVRVVSRVPRGATIRLPVSATEVDPAVIASGVSNTAFIGFRIVGDAATPLGVGVFVTEATGAFQDVEITGATRVAVDMSSGARPTMVGGDVHDNPGIGLAIRAGSAPRIAHGAFARNGTDGRRSASTVVIEPGAEPLFYRNVFVGMTPDAFAALGAPAREAAPENWFISAALPTGARPGRSVAGHP
jgi:serine/threonine protein phosphatase PrpC